MRKENLLLETLQDYVAQQKWGAARILADSLYQDEKASDIYWILNASICEAEGRNAESFFCMTRGLEQNPRNYELYYMLGNYYGVSNPNQAYLCYENALFYCQNQADADFIRGQMEDVRGAAGFRVRPVSIVILSYNIKDIMVGCIESIRESVPKEAYELVVVDNASSDGIATWLQAQSDMKLICNTENAGFAKGCNQGMAKADEQNDILLLNNDTILPANALFWLRMGLYERASVGAVGPLTNYAVNDQALLNDGTKTIADWLEIAAQIHLPNPRPYENKLWLVGFALLIGREALNNVGVLDSIYEWGNCEDTDYGLRLITAGYEQLLCYNSFIYHYGSLNMAKDMKKYAEFSKKNGEILRQKWGFLVPYFSLPKTAYLELLRELKGVQEILEIGCGCGVTLSRMRYLYPDAKIYGIERNEVLREMGRTLGNMVYSSEDELGTFDVILIGDELEYQMNPENYLTKLKKYLKPKGRLLAQILYTSGMGNVGNVGPTGRRLNTIASETEWLGCFEESGYRIKRTEIIKDNFGCWYVIIAE